MKIKIAIDDPQSMAQSGESILRSLQNLDFSYSNMIVRESIQNALDATIKGEKITKVDFRLGKFEAEDLNNRFEQISGSLNEKFSGPQDFLAISDHNTVGLTGDYQSDNPEILDKSNFQKLVFDIGNNQQAEGAGGSWGMGKTSYFRIGVGIVAYYTRVKLSSEEYEERLIVSLIENPKKDSRLLKYSRRGIAWWGDHLEGDHLVPITDRKAITDFLKIFELNNYSDNETGTMIIIPYLKRHLVDPDLNVPWEKSFGESIAMAVQRWYAPRLSNSVYYEATGRSILQCTLNGRNLALEMVPTFNFMQRLYNAALTGKADDKNPKIQVQDVILPRGFEKNKSSAGRIAYMLPTVEDLEMDKDKSSPTTYITSDEVDDKQFNKILGITRMPGMVVKYDINGRWTTGCKTENNNLLAFFVPKSDQRMYVKLRNQGVDNFEQYLRVSEKADHADWYDSFGENIVKRVIILTAEALSSSINRDGKNEETHISDRLAKKMGRLLLNPLNGNSGTKRPSKKGGNSRRVRTSFIKIIDSNFLVGNKISVKYEGAIKNSAEISLVVQTQDGRLSQEKWKEFFNNIPFPVKIIGFSMEEANLTKKVDDYNIYIEAQNPTNIHGTIELQINSADYDVNLAIMQAKEEGK